MVDKTPIKNFIDWLLDLKKLPYDTLLYEWMDEYALYTELVSEKEIDYAAHEAASKIGANTSSNESKYFKKGAKWLQQRQVIDKCDCPMCGSDDMFSFQQTSHKCRSCDYRFTK